VKHQFNGISEDTKIVAKSDLGTKRVCPDTGRKFYDLGKTPVISPYTGKVVPIVVPVQSRSRPESAAAAAAKAAPVVEAEAIVPETQDAEFVSLEDAEAEQQGKKPAGAEGAAGEEEEIEADESLDDAAFIEEQEEGDPDVTDIIGDGIEKEEET
jgi:uncharacterized protein (TIGR02300 family)